MLGKRNQGTRKSDDLSFGCSVATLENTMTPQQVVGLFVRLLAVWLAVSGVQVIGIGVALDAQKTQEHTLVPYVISAVLFVVALGLWLFPMVVAHKLVPRTHFDNVLHIPAQEVAVVACVVLGLWVFVARALPPLAQYFSVIALLIKNNQTISAVGDGYSARLVEGLVELAVASLLTFKARAIAIYFLARRSTEEEE